MQRSQRKTKWIFFSLLLSAASLFPIDDVYAGRGGGGRASRGGASPRVNRSVNLQNQGNFKSRPQPSGDRSQLQQSRQGESTQRQGERQDQRTERTDIRQGENSQRQGERQEERTERTDIRQEEFTDRQNNRQDFIDDNNNEYWRGGGWYGGGYNVPPGWGWVGVTAGLVIGSAIANPPPYYNTVYMGSTSYLYSDGVYLQPTGSTYTVVAPPLGAVVTYLPDGCTTEQINNILYYNCSGIYYQPFFQNGSTVYQVVKP